MNLLALACVACSFTAPADSTYCPPPMDLRAVARYELWGLDDYGVRFPVPLYADSTCSGPPPVPKQPGQMERLWYVQADDAVPRMYRLDVVDANENHGGLGNAVDRRFDRCAPNCSDTAYVDMSSGDWVWGTSRQVAGGRMASWRRGPSTTGDTLWRSMTAWPAPWSGLKRIASQEEVQRADAPYMCGRTKNPLDRLYDPAWPNGYWFLRGAKQVCP